jgi:HEAT repeat protein
MSRCWDQFESDFLNAHSWGQRKDGYPGDLIDALSPEEKTSAITILTKRLDGRDDWPVRAMAHLRVVESVPKLRSLLMNVQEPGMRAVIATSIFELTGDTEMERIVREVAEATALFWGTRIDAIYCLARFKTETAMRTLSALTNDPEYLVRYNAKRAGGERKQFWDPD